MEMSKKAIGSVLLCIAIILGGLSGCISGTSPSVDDIVSRLQEMQRQSQHMHAIVEMTFTSPDGQEQHMVVEQWVRGPKQIRMEYKDGPEELVGTLLIMDGQSMWVYTPRTNTYRQVNISELEASRPESLETPAQMQTMIMQMLETMDFTYLGQERIAGQEAYKLRAVSKQGRGLSGWTGESTLWIDAERWVVLAMEGNFKGLGYVSWRFQEVDYDPELPDDLLTFRPPSGAKRVEILAPSLKQFMTLEEAQQAVDFRILVPNEVPKGYRLLGVEVSKGDTQRVSLRYQQKGLWTKDLSITERLTPSGVIGLPQFSQGKTETISVRGHEGVLVKVGFGWRALMWQEGSMQIIISGFEDQMTLLQIAESLR